MTGIAVGAYQVEADCGPILLAPLDVVLVTEVGSQIDWVEPHVLAARVREVLVCDVHAELARVKVPIQYLWGAEDRLVAVECLEEILMVQPGTAVTVLDGPHLLLQREPEACAARVVEFLAAPGEGSGPRAQGPEGL